jgi:rhodanese-related sulfurtransferase/DNA-binding transcriptional ArsR family regulator
MAARAHKDALYEQLARIGKAVASARRLELLDVLGQAPRTVEEIASQAAMSIANTSQHLQVLRAAGLVEAEKDGLYVTYRLASDDVARFALQLRRLAESQLADVERVKRRFFETTDDLDPVTGKELLGRVRRGEVVLLDVRPTEEYEACHLPGAVSIPHDELKRRLGELSKDRDVVAYCRGPYCVFAGEAVKLLRARGFKATRIEDGVVDWRARGLPLERSGAEMQR